MSRQILLLARNQNCRFGVLVVERTLVNCCQGGFVWGGFSILQFSIARAAWQCELAARAKLGNASLLLVQNLAMRAWSLKLPFKLSTLSFKVLTSSSLDLSLSNDDLGFVLHVFIVDMMGRRRVSLFYVRACFGLVLDILQKCPNDAWRSFILWCPCRGMHTFYLSLRQLKLKTLHRCEILKGCHQGYVAMTFLKMCIIVPHASGGHMDITVCI